MSKSILFLVQISYGLHPDFRKPVRDDRVVQLFFCDPPSLPFLHF